MARRPRWTLAPPRRARAPAPSSAFPPHRERSAMNATALIAEDEPLLAQALAAELARAWPQLRVLATVGDGASAVTQALALQPDVLFFDIRMPGQSGLEAAAELADEWPPRAATSPRWCSSPPMTSTPCRRLTRRRWTMCSSPYRPQRLQKDRGQAAADAGAAPVNPAARPGRHAGPAAPPARRAHRRRDRYRPAPAPGAAPLSVIQASVGTGIRMVPVDEVLVL
jgi:CheY-like chemotaxis protein